MLTDDQRAYHREWYYKNADRRKKAAREYQKEYRKKNPEKCRAGAQKWKADNRDHTRNYLLKKTYGITLEQKEKMFEEQGNRCAICKNASTEGKNWHVDHCHKTKKVRGILCNHCNLMIGHAKDNAKTLLAAAEYLKK